MPDPVESPAHVVRLTYQALRARWLLPAGRVVRQSTQQRGGHLRVTEHS